MLDVILTVEALALKTPSSWQVFDPPISIAREYFSACPISETEIVVIGGGNSVHSGNLQIFNCERQTFSEPKILGIYHYVYTFQAAMV